MGQERLGPVSRLAADRPLLVTLIIAFGLSAIAVSGAAAGGFENVIADLALAVMALLTPPYLALALAPSAALARLLLLFALAAICALFYYASPALPPEVPKVGNLPLLGLVGAAGYLILLKPVSGPAGGLFLVGVLAAALGMIGGAGILAAEGAAVRPYIGPLAAATLGVGSVIGIGAAGDFTAFFARGSTARRSGGLTAAGGAALCLYGVSLAALAPLAVIVTGDPAAGFDIRFVWLSGASGACAAIAALFFTSSAFSLIKESENIAIGENYRIQAFRRFWRPFRAALPFSASCAISSLVAIVLIIVMFERAPALPLTEAFLIGGACIGAGLIFFSVRSALLVFTMSMTSMLILKWAWEAAGAPALSSLDASAALCLALMLFGQLSLVWRDARNPRLNARETTEAAMGAGLGRYLASACALSLSPLVMWSVGLWPNGLAVAIYIAFSALIGLFAAPPLMMTLGGLARREYG